MASVMKGIVEGFYGTPWTEAMRADVMRFAGANGMTHYLFGPKDDPPFRDRWRDPFTAEEMARYARMKDEADRHGLLLGFALSPGLDINFQDRREIEHLVVKFQQWNDIGIRWFGLFWDDIEPGQNVRDAAEFPDPGHAQSWVTNQVAQHFRDADHEPWVFCPTEYWDVLDSPYKDAVRTTLESDIAVIWTGPEICSERIPRADAERVSRQYGHALLIWDNYPVNDAEMVHELHLGPLTGRDPELLEVVAGYLANPMDRPQSSLVGLGTIAAYLSHPASYQADAALEAALDHWGADYHQAMLRLAQATLYSCCGRESAVSQEFTQAVQESRPPRLDALATVLDWENAHLEQFPAPLRGEIEPWVQKLQAVARWMRAALDGQAEEAEQQARLAKANPAVVYAGAVEQWLGRAGRS
jgi:hyaluronoglucosaminidase